MDILFIGHSLIEFFDWRRRFPAHNAANLGVAGETVEGLLSRVDKIIRDYRVADLVFIMTGANNITMEDYDFIGPYGRIIEKLSVAYPRAGIFVHSVLPIILEWVTDEAVQKVNRSIRRLTRKTGVAFLDIHGLFIDHRGDPVKEYFLEDGVHLSEKGYAVWSETLEKIIKERDMRPTRTTI